jgi:hypothetical protein
MYVNKPLSRVRAVQILSRLNRAHPQKHECFVPDLQNNSEAIAFAFQDENRTTLPTPKEVDLAKGILKAVDLDSYRVEKNAVMKIWLAERGAEAEPVPRDGEGQKPELELDGLSSILKTLNLTARRAAAFMPGAAAAAARSGRRGKTGRDRAERPGPRSKCRLSGWGCPAS